MKTPTDEELRARETRKAAQNSRAFGEWMALPETKLMLSLIPPGSVPEVVHVILLSAFNRGVQCGEGFAMLELMKTITERKP